MVNDAEKRNQTDMLKKRARPGLKKGIVIAIVVLLMLVIGTGCAKSYTLSSNAIYVVGGQKLKGSGLVDATLTLSDSKLKDGTSVDLIYAGRSYTGEVHYPYVFWDKDPYIFADATSMYTEIYGSGNTIHLTFTALVNEIWFESRQTYTSK